MSDLSPSLTQNGIFPSPIGLIDFPWQEIAPYTEATITAVSSGTVILRLQWSMDGFTEHLWSSTTIFAGLAQTVRSPLKAKYVSFTITGLPTATYSVQTHFTSRSAIEPLINLGAGAKLFDVPLNGVRSIVSSDGSLAFAENATEIDVTAAAGSVVALANEGGGAGVFDSVVGTTANLRSLLGTANGLTVAQGATTITVDNTLTGANLGAGTGTVFSAKSGAALQFNSLAGTASGLTVSAPAAGAITLTNTLTGLNLGAGSQVFSSKVGANLNMRSLTAGTGVALTQNTNDIVIATASGSVASMANTGAGGQWFSGVVGTTANLRTVLGTANGLTVAQGANDITLDNTLTGANLGAGAQVFSAKVGAALQFNSLAGTFNGLTVSAPVAGVITIDNNMQGVNVGGGRIIYRGKGSEFLEFNTLSGTTNGLTVASAVGGVISIDNTLTGANLGAGSQVFSAKVGAALNMRSLTAGTGITLTQNANDISIASSVSLTTWRFWDQKANGTSGGASSSGTQGRLLNTSSSSGPASGHIVLTVGPPSLLTVLPGRYLVTISCPAYGGNGHQARLVNNSGGATVLAGGNSYALSGGSSRAGTDSTIHGFLSVGATTVYRIEHRINSSDATGLGDAVTGGFGTFEVYTQAAFTLVG